MSQSEGDCSVLSLVPRLSFPCAAQKEKKRLGGYSVLECSQFVFVYVFVSLHTLTGPHARVLKFTMEICYKVNYGCQLMS